MFIPVFVEDAAARLAQTDGERDVHDHDAHKVAHGRVLQRVAEVAHCPAVLREGVGPVGADDGAHDAVHDAGRPDGHRQQPRAPAHGRLTLQQDHVQAPQTRNQRGQEGRDRQIKHPDIPKRACEEGAGLRDETDVCQDRQPAVTWRDLIDDEKMSGR